jgi:hypothetical protein
MTSGFFVPNALAVGNLQITGPEEGDYWRGNQLITWNSSGNAPYSVFYSTDFKTYQNIVSGTDETQLEWNTTLLADRNYELKVVNAVNEYAVSPVFIIDNTPPVSSHSILPDAPDGDNGWYVSVPTIALNCADTLSGCNETYYKWDDAVEYTLYTGSFQAPEGAHTLYYHSTDQAVDMHGYNNREIDNELALKIDVGVPVSAVGSPDASSWQKEDFTVGINDSDNVSGLVICEYQVRSKLDGNWQITRDWTIRNCSEAVILTVGPGSDCRVEGEDMCKINVRAHDNAGNDNWKTPWNDRYFSIDWTAPEVVLSAPAANTVAVGTLLINANATDDITTPACSYQFDDGDRNPIDCAGGAISVADLSEGHHTLNFYGVDAAGNESSDNVGFIVNNDGILTVCDTGADFQTIQSAIDAALSGDTVSVCAGTYNENVNIGKSLFLSGAGRETCLINGPVKISASGSAVSGFEIVPGSVLGEIAGVYLQGDLSGVSILNNRINGKGVSGNARGIVTESGSSYITIKIENNIIHDVVTGIYLNPHNGIIQIIGNEIYNTAAGIGGLNNAHVQGNYFYDNDEAIGADASISGTSYSIIENKILDPVKAYGEVIVNAAHNWWGTAHKPTITARNVGDVNIDPYYVDEEMTILSIHPVSETFVDDDYVDGIINIDGKNRYFGYDAFTTIQEGIDAVAANGVVAIASGNYVTTGQVVIDKNLTINGDTLNKPAIAPGADLPANNNAGGAWFLINAGIEFNLSNVLLNGDNKRVHQAIRSHGLSTINKVDFLNIRNSASPYVSFAIASFGGTVPGGAGADTHGSGGASSVLTVTDSTFTLIGRIGILLKGDGATAVLSGNSYTGKGEGDFLDYAIEIGAGGKATISNNTISDNRGVASDGSGSAGILVTDFYGTGTKADIDDNTITNCIKAIAVGYVETDNSVVNAVKNRFSGNDYAIYSTGPIVEAKQNWWGSNEGPKHVNNPFGLGDSATDYVNYVPWCTNPECSDYDTTAPTAMLSGLPADPTNITIANVSVGPDEVVYYRYTLSEAYGSETSAIDPIELADLDDGEYTLYVIGRDQAGNWQSVPTIYTWTVDTTAPVLLEVAPIPTPTNDNNPSYTFNSDEAGEISYSGGCFSSVAEALVGENMVTFSLADGYYDRCAITVTDAAGNTSLPLSISAFLVDTVNPEVNAGANVIINKQFTQIAAVVDDSSGMDMSTYVWSKVSGPGNIIFGSPNALETSILADMDGTYVIRFEAYDLAGNSASDEMQLIWDTVNPLMLSSSPVNGATGVNYPDGTATVRFNENLILVDAEKVMLSDNATEESKKGTVTVNEGTGMINIPFSGVSPATQYRINVMPGAVTDLAGNPSAENLIIYFTTSDLPGDEVSPTVNGEYPVSGASGVAVDVIPYLLFDEVVDSATIKSANIQIRKASDHSAVPAMVSLVEGGQRVNIVPNADLEFETEYYLYASAGVTDLAGNPLVEFTGEAFTTVEDTSDRDAPTVVDSWPSGQENVPVNIKPYVDFSELMKISSLTAINISLHKVNGEETEIVPASIVIKNGGKRAEIHPDSLLEYGASYKIMVEGVADEAGNIMNGVYQGDIFGTVSQTDVELAVTGVSVIRSMALAGGGFEKGWMWRFDITVPMEEINLWMRFNDWTNGAGGIIPAAGNMRYWSVQGDYDSEENSVLIESNAYPYTPITLHGDLSSDSGRQIRVYVQMQVPDDAKGGSYSSSYQVSTEVEIPV